tara:strand:- start:304 stop:495 length:192 start_codon:yes stop_codon:yes gene_type:complete
MDKRNWLQNWSRFNRTKQFDFMDFLALVNSPKDLEQLEDLKKVFLANLKVTKENIIKKEKGLV